MDHYFPKLIISTSNTRLRIRLLAVSHFTEGLSRKQVVKYLKVSRVSVNKWVKAYLTNDLDGLKEKPYSGRVFRLNQVQLDKIKGYVIDKAAKKKAIVYKGRI